MFWHDEAEEAREYRPPDDVFDLVFRLRGKSLQIDHAYPLAHSLSAVLDAEICARIGVHGVRLAVSGNGWTRPDAANAQLPLPRRARLAIRVHERDRDRVLGISGARMDLDGHAIEIGEARVRELTTLDTLFARAIACDPEQPETDFLREVAAALQAMGIRANKMLCGLSGQVRTADRPLFTRALMVAGLKPRESVELQRRGLGDQGLLGCGLFVPHKGIEAVFDESRNE